MPVMRSHTLSAAFLALPVLMFAFLSPVSAAASVNFRHMYDSNVTIYSSFKNISSAHNKWSKDNPSHCAAGSHKWWAYKAHNDVAKVASLSQQLTGATAAQRKKHVYRAMSQTIHDLRHWSTTQITPRLAKCKSMPGNSNKVDVDLANVANDLGLTYY